MHCVGAAFENCSETSIGAECRNQDVVWNGLYNHITPVLVRLPWLPVCSWAEFRMLVLNFKSLYGSRPPYWRTVLPYEHTCPLMSSSKVLLRFPHLLRLGRCQTGRWLLWSWSKNLNSVFRGSCLSPSITIFRHQVNTFLLPLAFLQWSFLPAQWVFF